jgi:hypothetical protein
MMKSSTWGVSILGCSYEGCPVAGRVWVYGTCWLVTRANRTFVGGC